MSEDDATSTVDNALAVCRRLLRSDPQQAAVQARQILESNPNHRMATLLLGAAHRMNGDTHAALRVLETLHPDYGAGHYETALSLVADGQLEAALGAFRKAASLEPTMSDAWRAIGDILAKQGDLAGAESNYDRYIKACSEGPLLTAAAAALASGRIAEAEKLLRRHLRISSSDVVALSMLAEVANRAGWYSNAQSLIERCLAIVPTFRVARHQYAIVLSRLHQPGAALREIDRLQELDPNNWQYQQLRAVVLSKLGDLQGSIELYRQVLRAHDADWKIWLNYGHVLAAAGDEKESVKAYRRGIRVKTDCGEAYWSLANLKTIRLDIDDMQAMRLQLERADLNIEDRSRFEFALAKTLEDSGQYADSFAHYANANRLYRSRSAYDADEIRLSVKRCVSLMTPEFFEQRSQFGAKHHDPIFIVGMPRAGSTLIEQILATHSGIEGTMELPYLPMMAANLAMQPDTLGRQAPSQHISALSAADCCRLGETYIAQANDHRKTPKALFVDKMPANFLHIGLIRLVLPHAKIIDARRHPMACCLSGFTQAFAEGHRYSYRLDEIGDYYRNYVALMDHFDQVIPGAVHRVLYEDLIDDTETEVKRLLAYCGMPFEQECLRFYENKRPVRTPSAGQVRQPIYRQGIDHWRHFEAWLQPLKDALGDVLTNYPRVPRPDS